MAFTRATSYEDGGYRWYHIWQKISAGWNYDLSDETTSHAVSLHRMIIPSLDGPDQNAHINVLNNNRQPDYTNRDFGYF